MSLYFKYEMLYLTLSKKGIHCLCEGGIEKSVSHDNSLTSLGKLRDANRRSLKTIFYPSLTLMINSYNLAFGFLLSTLFSVF